MNAQQIRQIEDGREPTREEQLEAALFSLVFVGLILAGIGFAVVGAIGSF